MTKKGRGTKSRQADGDYLPVSKKIVKLFYMVRLDLRRKDVAKGTGLSTATIDRAFSDGEATAYVAGCLLQFFRERVKQWNANVARANASKDDIEKEDPIPMITSLNEWPPGCHESGVVNTPVNGAAGSDGGQAAEACGGAVAGCPAMGVLEQRMRELAATSPAKEENRWGRVFVIHVARDESISVVQVRDCTERGERDVKFEESLKHRMAKALASEKSSGKAPGRPRVREFIARESTEGWVRIVEVVGESTCIHRTRAELLDPKWERRLLYPSLDDFDDFDAWDRRRSQPMKGDEIWVANRDRVMSNCNEELRIWGLYHTEPLEWELE